MFLTHFTSDEMKEKENMKGVRGRREQEGKWERGEQLEKIELQYVKGWTVMQRKWYYIYNEAHFASVWASMELILNSTQKLVF